MAAIAAVVASYCLGCLNAAYYCVRASRRQDIRALGSGNGGARNAGRLFGARAFVFVLLVDAAKGIVAVVLGLWAGGASLVSGLCALAVVAGHIWPVQLGWRGGKGVATASGAIVALVLGPARDVLLLVLPALFALLVFTHRRNLRAAYRRRYSKGEVHEHS